MKQFITYFSLVLVGLSLTACNTTSFQVTKADGTKVAIHNTRLFWSTESYNAVLGTNSASLTANTSTDTAAQNTAALAQAIGTGMAAYTAAIK